MGTIEAAVGFFRSVGFELDVVTYASKSRRKCKRDLHINFSKEHLIFWRTLFQFAVL